MKNSLLLVLFLCHLTKKFIKKGFNYKVISFVFMAMFECRNDVVGQPGEAAGSAEDFWRLLGQSSR